MSSVNFVFLAALVKGLVDAIKRVIPPLDDDKAILKIEHFWAKALTVLLSAVFVLGYQFDLLQTMGKPTAWLPLDYAATIVTVSLAAMGVNDIGNIWGTAGKADTK